MPARFNPAPGWPAAPDGWTPEPGWRPDPSWPAAPHGWQLWIDDATAAPTEPVGLSHGAAPSVVAASGLQRPWFKKKRFIIPIGLVVLSIVIGSLNGGDEPASESTGPVAAGAVEQTAPEGPSAEELAAEEEADRVAAEQKAAEDAAEAEADRVAAEQEAAAAAAAEAAKGTVSQQNAYRSAESYLSFTAFSRAGLLGQLTSEYGAGFPAADAEFAVARLEAEGGVDWNAEAVEAAKSYLEFTSFSRQGLLDQLTSEYGAQFTPEQAEYGVSQTGL
ncbi:Ltp family lipoprotein [Cellulomonas xylanilytica]|uniref:Putative host cell surface-exposed lipoprotein Ltp-like HTH region domain-containing protein n=1 Tax=Cellulomonas xylanilytica TaxID=233583 RepID=A0A510V0K6_9CELL|nr:Ltp family lipoprotein [Cellulomonas xylanilytica]GEK20389.1 hypothetical protein CXY01_09090 [Cellulomonas xylanilytica]